MIEFYQLSRDYQNPNPVETHPYYPPEESVQQNLKQTLQFTQTSNKPQAWWLSQGDVIQLNPEDVTPH